VTGAETYRFLGALVLVMVANMAPWASGRLMGERLAKPLDFGATLPDGSRLLGDHKTWRGLVAGALASAVTAWLLGHPPMLGIEFATLTLMADAASSFTKRRLRLDPGAEVPALDQVPEALLPLLVLADPLGISVLEAVAIAVIFLCLDIVARPLRHWQARSDR
jgi:CDP-2,3-bis-(O-geranylgeranyl)-sn-glycerol synthase